MEPMILNKRDNKYFIPLNKSQERSISKTKRLNYTIKHKAKSVAPKFIKKNYFPLVKNKNRYVTKYSDKRSLSNKIKRGSPKSLNKFNLSSSINSNFKNNIKKNHIKKNEINKSIVKIPFRGNLYLAKLGKSQSSYFTINNIKIPYSVNTTTGFAKKFNEDRVSIIVNVKKKNNWEKSWPKISYFSIFDGHGGSFTSNFLKDHLHKYIINSEFFILNMKKAILEGCKEAEKELLYMAKNNQMPKIDGSCGVFFFIIETKIYFGNIGDSRAIISEKKGSIKKNITIDHKPECSDEKKRILQNGGSVRKKNDNQKETLSTDSKLYNLPSRVYPGGLSVSRAFADFHAKDPSMNGKIGVLIATPEIFIYDIVPGVTDFLFMGCDGVFDIFETNEIIDLIWKFSSDLKNTNYTINKKKDFADSLERYGNIVNFVLKETMFRGGYDNLTCILIPFCNFL